MEAFVVFDFAICHISPLSKNIPNTSQKLLTLFTHTVALILNILIFAFSDTLRFYMIRETIYGDDAPFNYEHLKDLHNANLADGLGNLFRRGLSLCGKYTDVNAPTIPIEESDIVFDTAAFVHSLDTAMRELRLKDMTLILMDAVGKANKYLTDQEPWKMKNQPERQRAVVHTVLECCYYFAHVLLPICPIAGMLNTKLRSQFFGYNLHHNDSCNYCYNTFFFFFLQSLSSSSSFVPFKLKQCIY